MEFNFDNASPIYKQLIDQLLIKIAINDYKTGEKLPSVRELASLATINPNTVSKAYAQLETMGLITTHRTNGKFVTENEQTVKDLKKTLAQEYLSDFIDKMSKLGFDKDNIIKLLEEEGEI